MGVTRDDLTRLQSRITEAVVLNQYIETTESEQWSDVKRREKDFVALYRGEWIDIYPDGSSMPSKPLIENAAKNALQDLSSLAAEVDPAYVFRTGGDDQKDYIKARVKDSIAFTHWEAAGGPKIKRRLYMDILGAGFAVLALGYDKDKPYPTMTRLKPNRCWPDTRNGFLQDLLYIEEVKLREAARMYPKADLQGVEAWSDSTCRLVDYYTDTEVVKAIILTSKGKVSDKHAAQSCYIVDRWKHDLGCVPVAFVQLESYDESFRGMFDQSAAPLMTRNRIMQYVADYLYDMVHASFEEKNIRNSDDLPGPDTVYHHDQTAQESFMRRVEPAAPSPAVFGIAQLLKEETSNELVQPPSRVGNVSQSIASASFVDATQGRLRTVVKDLQDLMADLMTQAAYVAFKIDKEELDERKPLHRSVGNKATYKPSVDIDDYNYCKVQFGAASGIGRQNAHVMALQDLGSRAISLKTFREQLDWLDDPTEEQDQIDREDAIAAFKQRVLADPRMPLVVSAMLIDELDRGATITQAARAVMPELKAADEAAAQAAAGGPVPQGGPSEPGLEAQGIASGQQQGLEPGDITSQFQPPPLQSQFVTTS